MEPRAIVSVEAMALFVYTDQEVLDLIKFQDISKTFKIGSGAVQALQHVNLEVDK